ncbi:MAG: hypothetical protein ABIH92_03930 [Nanoarchaeota archaeon]
MEKKKKRSKALIIFLIVFLVVLVGLIITLAALLLNNNSQTVVLTNPIINLTDEQAIQQFDETFVRYLLYSIGADQLHNPPFSSDIPKIEIEVSDDVFSAEIKKRSISVSPVSTSEKDIIIKTTKLETVKMLRNNNYVSESFAQGKSTIELITSKTKLFTKGYLKIYNRLTGEEPEE